jgi:hypothetical protein
MARSSRRRLAPLVARQDRARQLLERDPLLTALKSLPELSDRSTRQHWDAYELEGRLSIKYGADVVPWPGKPGRPPERPDFRSSAADFSVGYTLATDLNDEPALPASPGKETLLSGPRTRIDPIWAQYPPRIQVVVRLDLVTEHDIGRLARQFRAVLKKALQLRGRGAHPLRWLRTVAPALFDRDLRRYDLHFQETLSFRKIAYLEAQQRRGRPVTPATLRQVRVMSVAAGAESSVRASVQRVYLSIHREPYRSRRQATGASGGLPYDCPTHGGGCPQDCSVLSEWWARVSGSLPKLTSGA